MDTVRYKYLGCRGISRMVLEERRFLGITYKKVVYFSDKEYPKGYYNWYGKDYKNAPFYKEIALNNFMNNHIRTHDKRTTEGRGTV